MELKKQTKLFLVPGILLAVTLAIMRWLGADLFVESIWYDKIMHLLGGAGACALACWIIVILPARWRSRLLRVGFPLIGRVSALFFGGLWEWTEALFPIITDYIPQGKWDTAFDMVFDYVGGHIAGRMYKNRIRGDTS